MRTTYVYKQGSPEPPKVAQSQVQQVVKPQVKTTSVSLSETYLLVKAIANNIQRDMMDDLEVKIYQNTDGAEMPRVEQAQVRPQSKRPTTPTQRQESKPSKSKLPLVIASILAVLIVISTCIGYYVVTSKNTASSIEDLRASVDRLYTSADKVDVIDDLSQSDLEDYFNSASKLKSKGKDVSDITDELTTISYFIQDKKKLDGFNDASFDLTTVGLSGDIETIVNNTKNYTVSSLVITITDKASVISTQYDTYVSLKLEMQGITDALSFDESTYTSKIELITHEPNKEELQGIYNILLANKEAAQAKAKVDAAKDKKELKKAKKDLEDAKALQEETQKKLKELQEKLQSKINYKESTSDEKSTETESSTEKSSQDSQKQK